MRLSRCPRQGYFRSVQCSRRQVSENTKNFLTKMFSSENDEHCFSSTFKNENFKDSEIPLPCYQNGPLRALAALQRTSSHSANEVLGKIILSFSLPYLVLESFKRLSPKQVEDLENPSHNWLASAKKQTDLSDVDIVRRHLISKTIKDCSLMIVFIPKKDGDIQFKMEIVDLDLKVLFLFLQFQPLS